MKSAVSVTRGSKLRFRFLPVSMVLMKSVLFRFRFQEKCLKTVGSSVSARIDLALLVNVPTLKVDKICAIIKKRPVVLFHHHTKNKSFYREEVKFQCCQFEKK